MTEAVTVMPAETGKINIRAATAADATASVATPARNSSAFQPISTANATANTNGTIKPPTFMANACPIVICGTTAPATSANTKIKASQLAMPILRNKRSVAPKKTRIASTLNRIKPIVIAKKFLPRL